MCSELYLYDVANDVWSCPPWQGPEEPNGRFAHSTCILPAVAATADVSADAITDSSSSSDTSNSNSNSNSSNTAVLEQQTVAVFGGVCPEEQGESPSVTLLWCSGTAA
jgi:hypothetical protein